MFDITQMKLLIAHFILLSILHARRETKQRLLAFIALLDASQAELNTPLQARCPP